MIATCDRCGNEKDTREVVAGNGMVRVCWSCAVILLEEAFALLTFDQFGALLRAARRAKEGAK